MDYILIQDYEILSNDYYCIIDNNNNLLGYIDEFISVKVGGTRVSINNEKVMLKKAKARKTDDKGRSYRPIITIYLEKQIEDSETKKVYKNNEGNYYYSFNKEDDEYICLFDELQFKYVEIQKRECEKSDNQVLVSRLQVWIYSERWNDIFLNTIDRIECKQIYTREYKKAIPVKYVFLTLIQAEEFKKNYKKDTYNSLLENNEWLWKVKGFLQGYTKLNRCEKRTIIDIIEDIDLFKPIDFKKKEYIKIN
jgi:hypothetical protein